MDIGDVVTLDSVFESCDICPNSGAGGKENRVNLLEKGGRVRFCSLKNGDGEEARYSRQTIEGVCFPTDFTIVAHVLSVGQMSLLKLHSAHGMVGP